ncbi:hypothetical protein QDR37_03380 [Amnibacterium sp. CER49]|uniref:hypothetical protein n=1 Tax=Amnibacterium sp. CER49 TaxID=3039161 RepID=UPI00244B1968|nr:hypothetical protein [Amnibacterium sp. CER49]MDH2442981.1 hypothetical protein [Amnibacterium sp. CER49]
MRARSRDVAAVVVLIVAGLVALAAWHPYGRWASLVLALAGLGLAAGIYRARPSAFPLRDDAAPVGTVSVDTRPSDVLDHESR